MHIEVAVSEMVDKLTILETKKLLGGLDVESDIQKLMPLYEHIIDMHPGVAHLSEILKKINGELWALEDKKRACEQETRFDDVFIEYSRLIYMINDERARVKKLIDKLSGSEMFEQKEHRNY